MRKRIKDTEYIRRFFNGTDGYQQIENVTIGKEYEIINTIRYTEEVLDYEFIDDIGIKQGLGHAFWEEIE